MVKDGAFQMLRQAGGKPTELEFVLTDALVPKDDLLRGQRANAIDPVLLFKMLLLGYL
jgi:hypothetical protein